MEDGQVCLPRPDAIDVSRRHVGHDLANVIQVVNDPRRKQLFKRHLAQFRMHSFQRKLSRRQLPSDELLDIRTPQIAELG